jgi:hypothetical protein
MDNNLEWQTLLEELKYSNNQELINNKILNITVPIDIEIFKHVIDTQNKFIIVRVLNIPNFDTNILTEIPNIYFNEMMRIAFSYDTLNNINDKCRKVIHQRLLVMFPPPVVGGVNNTNESWLSLLNNLNSTENRTNEDLINKRITEASNNNTITQEMFLLALNTRNHLIMTSIINLANFNNEVLTEIDNPTFISLAMLYDISSVNNINSRCREIIHKRIRNILGNIFPPTTGGKRYRIKYTI